MKKICLLPLLLLVTGTLFGQISIKERIGKIIDALNTKNSEALIGQLDDSCKIANLPRGNNRQVIPMVLRNYGVINSYKIVQETTADGCTKVFLDVLYQNGKQGHPWFLMNDNKILEMYIIKDVVITRDNEIGKATVGGEMPDVMTIPFFLIHNLIYVAAEVNGTEGLFQLDNGSPVILLNRQFFPGTDRDADMTNQLNLTGFNGKLNHVSLKQINSLKWGEMTLHNFKAASVDMSDDADTSGAMKVFGLLGYEVFKDYELTLDYRRHTLTLIKVDEAGNYLTGKTPQRQIKAQTSLVMQRHLPVIPIKIDGKTYQMGIDCGANANVIYARYEKQLKPLLSAPMQQQLVTAGNGTGYTQTYLLNAASVGNLAFTNMLTILSADNMYMPNVEKKLEIDGLLGTPFLDQYIITINFRKRLVTWYRR